MSLASDFAFMLKDAPDSVSVAFNGVESFGVLDRSSDYMPTSDGVSVQVRTKVLTIQNGVFPNLRIDARLVVGGNATYIVRDFDNDGVDDGIPMSILVMRAP